MKRTLTDRLRTVLSGLIIVVQVFFFPAATMAQESSDVPPTEGESSSQAAEDTAVNQPVTGPTEPTGPSQPTGVQQPTGADSTTYTFNESTGLWENDFYTWNPATGQTKPKNEPTYSYNPTTGMWDTTEWYYSPESGRYEENRISTAANPTVAPAANSISNTGPNSNNTINQGGTTNGSFDLYFNAAISNKIGQMSRSGDASVLGNTLGGNALSGDAQAIANVLSMLQSSWGTLGNDDIAYFLANIDGDITGDLYVDPNGLAGRSGNTDIDVNVSSDAAIHNDIDVEVASGDATVSNNTKGGNATTGNAQAVVNLLNLINSAITANKSFVGVLNINGNLNGDILLPPEMMQTIIAATGPNSNNQINNSGNTNFAITADDNKTINNDINADAATGNAIVANNTNGGGASTGNASSNVVLLNLTGKKVVAKNALLVFVNVMGSWVGLIYDAPAGTTSVAATGPGSNNTITDNHNLTVDADIETDSLIDNEVDVSATSGDATVSNNTNAGDAKTGDATVGVNILNMIDSEFDVEDWFGVLFINVFGSWVGSFGVNTEAGNQLPVGGMGAGNSPTAPIGTASTSSHKTSPQKTFSFVPRTQPTQPDAVNAVASAATDMESQMNYQDSAAAVSSNQGSGGTPTTSVTGTVWLAGIATFIGALMLGGERLITLIRTRQVA